MIHNNILCILNLTIFLKICKSNNLEYFVFAQKQINKLQVYSLNMAPFVNFDENRIPISGIEYDLMEMFSKKINNISKYHVINPAIDLQNIDHQYLKTNI